MGPAILTASLALTPRGHLLFTVRTTPPTVERARRRLEAAFARGSGHGLLELGAAEVGTALPADFELLARLRRAVRDDDLHASRSRRRTTRPSPRPRSADLEALAAAAPPMTGAEYLTAAVLEALWTEIANAFRSELAESKASVQEFLQRKNPAWHLVGRVHFNLAENRRDDEAPFAFLATYTTQTVDAAKAQHLPLGRALSEYAGAANKSRLLSLLLPVQRAAAECPWLKTMVDVGRDLSPAAVDARRGVSTADRCPPPRGRRRHRARTDRVAGESSAAPAGHGHRRRQAAVGPRHGRAARLQDGRQPRRRTADRGRD